MQTSNFGQMWEKFFSYATFLPNLGSNIEYDLIFFGKGYKARE